MKLFVEGKTYAVDGYKVKFLSREGKRSAIVLFDDAVNFDDCENQTLVTVYNRAGVNMSRVPTITPK